jgi:hypothetical protein
MGDDNTGSAAQHLCEKLSSFLAESRLQGQIALSHKRPA